MKGPVTGSERTSELNSERTVKGPGKGPVAHSERLADQVQRAVREPEGGEDLEPSATILSFCCTPPLPVAGVSIADGEGLPAKMTELSPAAAVRTRHGEARDDRQLRSRPPLPDPSAPYSSSGMPPAACRLPACAPAAAAAAACAATEAAACCRRLNPVPDAAAPPASCRPSSCSRVQPQAEGPAGPAPPCTQMYGFNRVKVERRKEEEGLVGLATIGWPRLGCWQSLYQRVIGKC